MIWLALGKIRLYINTVKHLKVSQVFYRSIRRIGLSTPLKRGHRVHPSVKEADISFVPTISELNFDLAFLRRFDPDEIIDGRITLLNHSEEVNWTTCWHDELSTPLWQFNLHYFEYLFSLAKHYRDYGDTRYLSKAKEIILLWIDNNPQAIVSVGWDPYTISMRVVNWLAFISELIVDLQDDRTFLTRVNQSLAEQYDYLSRHLEKDLLANHYLENLKALIIMAIYFKDEKTLNLALSALKQQVAEQILPDGMHFELSPMYHKIVLEDLLRIAVVLRKNNFDYKWLLPILQKMGDCLYSLERLTERTPLFNDSGDNIAKNKCALLQALRVHFNIKPTYRDHFPDAGYYLLEHPVEGHTVKIIVDAGNAGPEYALGHAHCDALSFEVFLDGKPWIINCGTYAYQDTKRPWFKSAKAHTTVVTNDNDQHECWASFRIARYGKASVESRSSCSLKISFVNYIGERLSRELTVSDEGLEIKDESIYGVRLTRFLYFSKPVNGAEKGLWYAPSFGELNEAYRLVQEGEKCIETFIKFSDGFEDAK